MIHLDELSVSFGSVRPIAELSITIEAATHGVIGPNGAGKTTLLNALSGFVNDVDGSIVAFDDDLLAMKPRARAKWGLRRTFQTVQLAEDLGALDNVLITLDHCPSLRPKREAALAALKLVGLSRFERHASELSTYERRLCEIARAIAGEPRLILLDEPAAGVSSSERAELTDLLLDLEAQTGAWLIVIDHDVDLISTVCVTATALDFGAHVASGPTNQVLNDPAVVASYLGNVQTESE